MNLFTRKIIQRMLVLAIGIAVCFVPAKKEEALAQFSPLLDPTQIANFQEICYDVASVAQIIMLFQTKLTVFAASSPGGQVSSALFSVAQFAQGFQDVCRLVVAVGTAKDTAGVLRAARVANRMGLLGLESQLDLIEDTIGFHDFLDNLKNSKQSNKQKLLNVNNYSRVLDFSLRNLPLDGIDAKVVAQKLAKEERRSASLAQLTDEIYGCRAPMKDNKDNKLKVGDGSFVSDSEVSKMEADMAKYSNILNRSSAVIPKIASILRNMISQVTHVPEERRGALGAMHRFMKEGIFVSVGFIPPKSTEKTDGEKGVKENKIADLAPEENPETGNPVRQRPTVIEIEDGTDSYYKDKGTRDFRQCANKATTKLENWMFLNASVLSDPYIKKEWIADTVDVCPAVRSNVLTDTLIQSLAINFDDKLMDKAVSNAVKTLEENCKKRNTEELVKRLNDTNSFANFESSNFNRVDDNPCKVSESVVDNLTPIDVKVPEEIKNMADFVNFYNNAFGKFIAAEYRLSASENPVSDSFRKYSRSTTDMVRGGDGSYNSSNRFTMEGPATISPEQMRFLQRWRTVSLCMLPSQLIRMYPDAKDLLEKPSSDPDEFASLIKKCQDNERDVASNEDIFSDFFLALVDEMLLMNEAKAEIFKIDVKLGAFMGSGSVKPAGCYESYTPADVALANARVSVLAVESLNSLNTAVDQLNQYNQKKDEENRVSAQRLDDITKTSIGSLRESRIRQNQAIYDTANPQLDYGKIAPDVRGTAKIDEENGFSMSQ